MIYHWTYYNEETDTETEWEIEYIYHPAERQTRVYPGWPAEIEIIGARSGDETIEGEYFFANRFGLGSAAMNDLHREIMAQYEEER